MAAAMEDDRDAFGARREADAAGRKAWRAEQKEALDELLPKATGRCAPRMSSIATSQVVMLEGTWTVLLSGLPG